ncbi:hypothetical protein RIR_jg861.t1 [Rhizophagus irregularis DAOM 181602=DAOM 197198]|nr:hypothetical protein RIR_jg861.t1 [Rhizophagus irregularis DAOM 181602=DAOM 197198]
MDEVIVRIGLAIRKRSSGLFNVVEIFEGVLESPSRTSRNALATTNWHQLSTFFLGLIRYLDTQKHSLASIVFINDISFNYFMNSTIVE